MRLHLTPKQFRAFKAEILRAQKLPQITPDYLKELAYKRDQYLLFLSR